MKTPKEIIEQTCTDKVSLSKEEADHIIDRKARAGKVFYYYKCEFCMRYHLSKHDYTVKRVEIIGGTNG